MRNVLFRGAERFQEFLPAAGVARVVIAEPFERDMDRFFTGGKLRERERSKRRDPSTRGDAVSGGPGAVGELLRTKEVEAAGDVGLRGCGRVGEDEKGPAGRFDSASAASVKGPAAVGMLRSVKMGEKRRKRHARRSILS
jgi:hypothetical protein